MELRETFDTVAELYATARPSYPDEIVALLPGGRVLEVGCGAGQLTKLLVARGDDVTCVELGPNLARVAQRDVPAARVVNASFETWTVDGTYDVVTAATAWGWIGPVKYEQAHRALRPGGHLAVIGGGHTFPPDADPFFREIQAVYEAAGEPPQTEWPSPATYDPNPLREEILATGLFTDVTTASVVQELLYTPASYIDVLKTFSGHILMTEEQRNMIFDGVRRLAGETIRKHLLVSIHLATRVG
jgi:trans-aconitate methyltransferase